MKKRGIVKARKAKTLVYYCLASTKIAEASDLLRELVKEKSVKASRVKKSIRHGRMTLE